MRISNFYVPAFCGIFACLTVFVAVHHGTVAFAQIGDIAGSVQLSEDDLRRRRVEDQQVQRAFDNRPKITIGGLIPDLPELGESADKKIIPLDRVVFEPTSRVLSQQELDKITAPYIAEQKVSLNQLYQLIREIDKLYDTKKILGRATILDQDVRGGTVKIELIEGKYGNIKIVQQQYDWCPDTKKESAEKLGIPIFDYQCPQNVKQSFLHPFLYQGCPIYNKLTYTNRGSFSSLKPGTLVRTEQLENDILRYNMLYDAKLTAELEPGTNEGESDLLLRLHPAKPFDVALWMDNYGRPSTGIWRYNAMLQLRNLTGLGDSWTATVVKDTETDGVMNMYVGGRLPIHRSGTQMTASFETGNYALINGPFSVLEIDGWSRRSTFGITQPLMVEQKQLVKMYAVSSFYESQNYLSGFMHQRSLVQSATVGLTQEKFAEKSYTMFDLSLVTGTEWNIQSMKWNYNLMRGSLLQVYQLDHRWSLQGRLSGQWGWKKSLAAIEQFQIGGMGNVRGFTEGMLAGDSGYYVSGELHRQLGRCKCRQTTCKCENIFGWDKNTFSTFTFFDHGGVFPDKGDWGRTDVDDFLWSVGLGLNYAHGKHLQSRVTFSVPLRKNALDMDYQESRLNLFVQYQF